MSTSHTFVIAQFVPKRLASWTSSYGIQQPAVLETRPFLALRLSPTYIGLRSSLVTNVLFLVSNKKPEGSNSECYFALGPASLDKVLHVHHLPHGRTLYVHTFPKLFEDVRFSKTGPFVPGVLPYYLEDSSFLEFCRAVVEHHNASLQGLLGCRYSGGDEPVMDDWDTWSGQSAREHLHERHGYVFEYLRPEGFDLSALESSSSIYEELLLYKQLVADYSWSGVTRTVSWALELRKHRCAVQRTLTLPSVASGNMPSFGDDIVASASSLNSMKIPFDGDPSVDAAEEEQWDWDDGPDPDFPPVPNYKPAILPSRITVIAFDLLGTILDHEAAIERALRSLAPPNLDKGQLLDVYFECETLRYVDNPQGTYADVARGALQDVCARLGLNCSNPALEDALRSILRPGLHDDAMEAVNLLSSYGYTLLALPLPDADSFSLPPLPCEMTPEAWGLNTSARFAQTPRIFPGLLALSRSRHPDVDSSQILVVTPAAYRVSEPANAAGFPTALIQRPGNLEPRVDVGTHDPTLVAVGLRDLCAQLQTFPIKPAPHLERSPVYVRPFRICGLYQTTESLGTGSFGNVFSAFHVFTGEEVAIKVEMPSGKPNDVCVLPYEAQVYRVLHGHPGITLLRWYGMDGGAHVLILDKLGANLQQVRRLCRGQLSLKTVTMLALQMLDLMEHAHSRGVILRDIKPENFAMGIGDRANVVHSFDLGLAKLFMNPITGNHISFREDRVGLGTPRYASYNVHFGREQSRRDDLEALGNVLLFLFHGRLPWQGIYAPSIEAKLLRIGEMKAGPPFRDLLARSPPEFTRYFDHCRDLKFEDKPNYDFLKQVFRDRMDIERWTVDDRFDWMEGAVSPRGTLVPEEYRFDVKFTAGDVTTLDKLVAVSRISMDPTKVSGITPST